MLLLTLRGTLTLYYGDEIEMTDVKIPPEMTQDPQGASDPEYSCGSGAHPDAMEWHRALAMLAGAKPKSIAT